MEGSLDEDLAALRKLRDESECDELKQAWSGNDPRGCTNSFDGDDFDTETCADMKNGRVTEFKLQYCSSLTKLPDAIGELNALTMLNLFGCWSLAALPAAIGKLSALTSLNLSGSLAALPDAIGELKALTMLDLAYCSRLTELPAAIGELGALETLILRKCSGLKALPDSIGKLGALSTLELKGCPSLAFPPEEMRGDVHKTIGFCCLNPLEGGNVSTADVEKSILNHVIVDPAHDERSDALVREDPAFADITHA